MSNELLLVGSIPLRNAEEVFRTFGGPLGPYLDAMPDGEIGERRWWVIRIAYQVFNGHPELEMLRRPKPDDGVERLVPRDRSDSWQFKVRTVSTPCGSDIPDCGSALPATPSIPISFSAS